MLVVVGHGPSILGRNLGSWLDTQTVVRLKYAERPTTQDWGVRTDYVCASTPSFWTDKKPEGFPECQKWVLSEKKQPKGDWLEGSKEWFQVYQRFWPNYHKPSTGLKAIFCAIEFLGVQEIGLIGFDRILRPDVLTSKWHHPPGKYSYGHDAHAENRCLHGLGVKIVEITQRFQSGTADGFNAH